MSHYKRVSMCTCGRDERGDKWRGRTERFFLNIQTYQSRAYSETSQPVALQGRNRIQVHMRISGAQIDRNTFPRSTVNSYT